LGHQNLTVPLFTITYGTDALAFDPLTVVPVKLPTVIVAPKTNPLPEIVTDWFAVIPYVGALGVTAVIDGVVAETVNPFDRVTPNPPAVAGLVTVTE
jgi:hypothetical protein